MCVDDQRALADQGLFKHLKQRLPIITFVDTSQIKRNIFTETYTKKDHICLGRSVFYKHDIFVKMISGNG